MPKITTSCPAEFLQSVMRDADVPIALRVDAAKMLLRHERLSAKGQKPAAPESSEWTGLLGGADHGRA
ncbi:MAG: hypothetical protein EB072_06170 [Betaproteobacteria bacterium]|nr:hypothetical protein [Betaproteobacteria bacterium]